MRFYISSKIKPNPTRLGKADRRKIPVIDFTKIPLGTMREGESVKLLNTYEYYTASTIRSAIYNLRLKYHPLRKFRVGKDERNAIRVWRTQ